MDDIDAGVGEWHLCLLGVEELEVNMNLHESKRNSIFLCGWSVDVLTLACAGELSEITPRRPGGDTLRKLPREPIGAAHAGRSKAIANLVVGEVATEPSRPEAEPGVTTDRKLRSQLVNDMVRARFPG